MSVYVLSYDVKDSAKTDNDEFRKKISLEIFRKLKPGWIHRPVASTIYFSCQYDFTYVQSVIVPVLKAEVYYIISKVEVNEGSTKTIWQKDKVLYG